MKISIIIPAFNAEEYIDRCLESILNDKLKEKEIIIINDGSKDNTLNILRNYEQKYEFIKVIDQKNSGQAVARNKAIDIAQGKYITFVDIDDFVEKNIFYKMYNVAEKNKADLVYSDYYEYYGNNNLVLKKNYFTDDPKKNAVLANFAPWGKLYNTNFFKKTGLKFLEGRLFEDIAIVPVLAALSNKSIRIKEPLYYYNCSNVSSIRKKIYNKKLEDIFISIDITYNNFKVNNLLDEYNDEIEFIFLDSFLKGSVFRFADFKEGLKFINPLRKKIKNFYPKLLKNKYYKELSLYMKLLTLISYYFPPHLIYLIKKVKK